MNNQARACIV